MKIKNTIQAALLIGMCAVLLAPTNTTAAVVPSIKEGQEKSETTGKRDGKASFSFVVAKSGWTTFMSEVSNEKYLLNFAGAYVSHVKADSGTAYALLVDPKEPGVVSDKLTIKYKTSDKGVIQIEGSFQSYSDKTNLGAAPNGLGGFEQPSRFIDIRNFYNGVYRETTLPGELTFSVQSPIATVPEPEEYTMLLLGFGMVGYQIKRKQKQLSRVLFNA